MKKMAENRYPHAATLFKFCKEALEIRYEGNVKVIDQDVGAILGYDPADCSHWKKGKKNIRALATLRTIADHLNIDERLLIDVAAGKVGLEEAIFEYRGYGSFGLQGRNLENLRKEYFKNPAKWQGDGGSVRAFEELFDVNRETVVRAADAVLEMGNFTEAPIYLPEICSLFPGIRLEQAETLPTPVVAETAADGSVSIRWRGPEMRPYQRYMIAKEVFLYLVRTGHDACKRFAAAPAEVLDIQANLFASVLLIPGKMLRREVEEINSSLDIILQLSETFWTSKAMMNQRLRDYMEHLN